MKSPCTKSQDFLDIKNVDEALKVSLAKKVHRIVNRFIESKASKKDFINSLYAQDIFEVSTEHIRYVSFFYFRKYLDSNSIKCNNLKKHLTNLCILYGLWNLYKDCKGCYLTGYFDNGIDYADFILDAIKQVNTLIRPQALNIIESFKLPDHQL